MLFHGTRCECRIGETPTSVTACASETCNVCNIIKGSYSMEEANTSASRSWSCQSVRPDMFNVFAERMFGPGIYTTKVSSKADVYVDNVGSGQNKRIMIVNLVALGRSKIMYEASHGMQDAPPMYDSVRFSFHHGALS